MASRLLHATAAAAGLTPPNSSSNEYATTHDLSHPDPGSPSPLSDTTINPRVISASYAVRGPLATKAESYRKQLKSGDHKLPFDRIISANIGNPQQAGLDQPPLTFWRQIAALTEYPALLSEPAAEQLFPADTRARATELLKEIGSVGAYSHSQGVPFIRQHVANFISKRDGGRHSDPDSIFLTAGASAGVSLVLQVLASQDAGVLIPIPQYPLYTATLAVLGTHPLSYNLSEQDEWSLQPEAIERAIAEAAKHNVTPRALVVINPGNPTGSLLSKSVMLDILHLCAKHNLVLLADEVYQANIHDPSTHTFISFSSLLTDPSHSFPPIPLVSFHSISKGLAGECGRRGGYFELLNFPPDVTAQIYKLASIGLCPPVSGQIAVDSLVRPPQPGDPSYDLFHHESTAIARALAQRTATIVERLNALPGVSCQPSSGALYVYPSLFLPPKAVEEAKKRNQQGDEFYAECLLDETGICVTPGSGFGQKKGEAHVRFTILCPGVDEYVGRIEKFHKGFMEKWQ